MLFYKSYLINIIALIISIFPFAYGSNELVFQFFNAANHPIQIYWMEEGTTPIPLFPKPIKNNTVNSLTSYHNHKFLIRYADNKEDLETMFTKGPSDEYIQIIYDSSTRSLQVIRDENYENHSELTSYNNIYDAVSECLDDSNNIKKCITDSIFPQFKDLSEVKSSISKLNDDISLRLRNYSCADPLVGTTEPKEILHQIIDDKEFDLKILLDTEHAKIWAIDDFITQEECNILESHGRPLLRRATVAAEDGSAIVSENRKAQQALYDLHRNRGEEDPLWDLQMRILNVVNHHAGYNLKPDGQEGFTIIQYNAGDQYTPHCDGACDDQPHIDTGRIATAVLYCKAPIRGGATSFTKADIMVNPKVGAATFFTYKGSDGKMDFGLTEHSGCPVLEGEKWITAFWMREGVSNEKPWIYFDPSGLPILQQG